MKTLLSAIAFAAVSVVLAPAQAHAQAYEDIIAAQSEAGDRQPRRSNGEAEANAVYGETQVDDSDYSAGADANAGSDDTSYDQAAIGTEGPQDIYSYIERGRGLGPSAQRNKDAKDTEAALQKHRAAVVQKMKRGSEMMLQKQKERAWKLAHPGQEYSKDEDGEVIDGSDEAESYSDDGGGESSDE